MKHLIIILLAGMIGCKTQSVPQNQTADKALTYLALGDSYTIGESVAESGRWPVQLAKEMSEKDIEIASPKIIARTGWTTDELKAGITAANIDNQTYDMVSLLIGVNNQYRGRDAEQFRSEFIDLLNQSVAFAGGKKDHVFVVSIPDWGVTPFAQGRDQAKIAKEIDAYNAVCKEEAEQMGIKYFDITPISREATKNAELVASDGLHPSAKMYERWVKEVMVKGLLK